MGRGRFVAAPAKGGGKWAAKCFRRTPRLTGSIDAAYSAPERGSPGGGNPPAQERAMAMGTLLNALLGPWLRRRQRTVIIIIRRGVSSRGLAPVPPRLQSP